MAEGAAAGSNAPGPIVLQPGQVIQNYEIVKPLGKGKFSIVYMAKRLTDNAMCALKKINIFDMMVPKQREKCLKEVRLLQSLDHPNIVKLKDSFIDNNELLIIVEWAEKGDLKRLIRRAVSMDVRFKEMEIWEYSRQLSSALDHMHRKRIMHRDLKPANIFVAMDGSLKLGDLGLGRFFSSQTLEAFSKVGTPLYMSPEVLRGAGYDMKSDVWSLGCVLYELTMLRSPFKSDQQLSLYDLFVRISKGDYPPLPETVSVDFRELVDRMLQLDPTKRFDVAQVYEICIARVAALAALAAAAPVVQKGSSSAVAGADGLAAAAGGAPGVAPPPRTCRPSPLLVMDDIVEKLKLLECEENFLRPHGFPILHRCFFAQRATCPSPPGAATQFEVMYELMQWLLGMLQARDERVAGGRAEPGTGGMAEDSPADVSAGPSNAQGTRGLVAEAEVGAGDAAAGGKLVHPPGASASAAAACAASARKLRRAGPASKTSQEDVVELTRELVVQLKGRGIQISSEATLSQLHQGHGEGVCLILNELINQELVGRDFHFEEPMWSAAQGSTKASSGEEEDLEDEIVDTDLELSEGGASDEEAEQDLCSVEASLPAGVTAAAAGLTSSSGFASGNGWPCVLEGAPTGGLRTLEPVYEAKVDVGKWREEVERAKPLLRISGDAHGESCGWRRAVAAAQQLCLRIQSLQQPLLASDATRRICSQWRTDLEVVRTKENWINATFGSLATDLGRLRDSRAEETERVAALHESIAGLSEVLSSLGQDLDRQKAAVTNQSEAAQDAEQVQRLKRALAKLKDESQQLEVRVNCVQADLTARCLQKRAAPTTVLDAGVDETQ
mmetsp:Transcript_81380/g.141227  ORF Transcript_81380/g.141227 Transcript_81380/m.141227 type:complete len:841 (-) Transcript_81380:136-2658(-)